MCFNFFKKYSQKYGVLLVLFGVMIGSVLSTGCTNKIGQVVADKNIKTLLILPIENNSNNEQADYVFPSVLRYVFAERGYYVYAPEYVRAVLAREHLLANKTFKTVNPKDLALIFGADGVLAVTVNTYEIKTRVIYTNRRIGLSYRMYNKDGNLMHQDVHYVTLPLDPNSSEYNPVASIVNGISAALAYDSPVNVMQASTAISYDFAVGPYHDDSFGLSVSVPFQDKIILEKHPRDKSETRLETDRDPDNI